MTPFHFPHSHFMEALGNALERLLLFGRDSDFALIDEWLDEQMTSR